ncbi:protein CANDIDATE G-PROTEIN COUPLED RECEPTOR 7-like [Syzygium oleosum]|uniref:protein CANDIDATE G-PROTEIN COUPLED RECEPTOR 7-like n=1 Tax=Syzygium oleosum TaxID=219896 RepID=UPI0024B9A021|nr:protein CANDIDATE G-PROTEIN COUPLED RECEPTOR 7-like [Syzygium oleosum]
MAKLHYALLLLISLISHANADIKTLSLTSDPRQIIFLRKFAFTHHGQVFISASDVSVTSSSIYTLDSRFGFFLLSKEALRQVLLEDEQNADFCVLDSFYTVPLFTFRDLSPPPHRFFNRTYPINNPGEYSLFFAKCDPVARVSMNVHVELYNLDSNGSKNYLSIGQSRLILLFFMFSLAFFFLSVLWAYCCYCSKESTNRVHLLITGLITVKTLSLICAGLDTYFVKLTGTPHGCDIMFQVTRVISSLIITALIIIGFFFFKPFLQEKEAQVLIVTIALQVLPNLAFPFAVTMGDAWPGVVRGLAFLSMICTCTFLVTVGRSIWLLRKAAKTEEKAAMRLAKIEEFALYYVLAIGYLYVTVMVAIDLRIVMAYEYNWVSNAVEEGVNLTIFVVTLCMFGPVNDFILLDAENEKEETMAVANE